MATDDLYVMLGLRSDAKIAEVRSAYERAVADAARSHNIRRATQLSNAFDRLPELIRDTIYPSRGAGGSASWERPRRRRRPRLRLTWLPAALGIGFGIFLTMRHFDVPPFGNTAAQVAPVTTSQTVPPAPAKAPVEVTGTPTGPLIGNRYREWQPPEDAVLDSAGATQGHCVASRARRPLTPLHSVEWDSLMACPTGSLGYFLVER